LIAEIGSAMPSRYRESVQIHAQAPVHGPEALGKLEAGIAVVAPDAESLFN
jgi:hypothetical protein